jgi:hypothetical protein
MRPNRGTKEYVIMTSPDDPRYLEPFYKAFGAGQSIPGRLMPRPEQPEPQSEEDPSTQESEVGVRSAAEDGDNE